MRTDRLSQNILTDDLRGIGSEKGRDQLRRQRDRFKYILVAAVAISVIAGMYLSRVIDSTSGKADARTTPPESSKVRLFEPPLPLQAFSLTDHNGQMFNSMRLFGQWSFVFFGYTHCPDVCPIALVDLNAVYKNLERKYVLGNTQVLFVSVDPVRDELKQLSEYITYFNENFIGVTGTTQQIDYFARQFGAVYKSFAKDKQDNDYLVDHTASIMLVDHVGRIVAVFPPPHDPKFIASEFLRLRERYGSGYDCILKS